MQNASNTTSQGLLTGGSPGGKLTITGTLTHTLGNITLNSSGPGNSSIIDANTVINNGGSWTFGTTDGTQKLIVGSGGLTIGNGSTIAIAASAAAANNHQPWWQCHQHRRRHHQHHKRGGANSTSTRPAPLPWLMTHQPAI